MFPVVLGQIQSFARLAGGIFLMYCVLALVVQLSALLVRMSHNTLGLYLYLILVVNRPLF